MAAMQKEMNLRIRIHRLEPRKEAKGDFGQRVAVKGTLPRMRLPDNDVNLSNDYNGKN